MTADAAHAEDAANESSSEAGSRAPTQVVVEGGSQGFAQRIRVGRHNFQVDEPAPDGGTETGPSPYDLLLAALGSCTSMTMSLYARRRQWPLESVRVTLRHSKVHATDCTDCETRPVLLDRIQSDIELLGPLDSTQRDALLSIAEKCPVHRTLTAEAVIETRLL